MSEGTVQPDVKLGGKILEWNILKLYLIFQVLTPRIFLKALFLQVMPGLLLCFVLRYDAYKKSQLVHLGETGVPTPKHFSKLR